MTDPRKYLFRMIIFVLVVIGVATLLGQPLIEAFNGNPAINGLILSVLIVGIIFLARQTP